MVMTVGKSGDGGDVKVLITRATVISGIGVVEAGSTHTVSADAYNTLKCCGKAVLAGEGEAAKPKKADKKKEVKSKKATD